MAMLNIEFVFIEVYCLVCDKNLLVKDYKFVCFCGCLSSDVVSGIELFIYCIYFVELALVCFV